MKTKVKVSIIIPTYNCSAFIQECLDSVLNQIRPDCEVIAVDDGSGDDTKEILQRYAGKYDCVLTACVEFGDSTPAPADNVETRKHPYKRDKMTMDKFLRTTQWLYDRTYTRALMAGQEMIYDDAAEWFIWEALKQQVNRTEKKVSQKRANATGGSETERTEAKWIPVML